MSKKRLRQGAIAASLAVAAPLAFLPCYADDKDKKEEDEAFARKLIEIIEKVSAEADSTGMDRTSWGNMTEGQAKEAQELENRLDVRKVSIDFEGSTFDEAIDFLRDMTDLNIVVTRRARDVLEGKSDKIKLRLKDVKMRNALELILIQTDPTFVYGIRHGVLELGTVDDWKGKNLILQLISVEDILYRPPDMPGPPIGMDFFSINKMKK